MGGSATVAKEVVVYSWTVSGDFSVNFGFLVDPLSMIMMFGRHGAWGSLFTSIRSDTCTARTGFR